jgi:benzodiazapine receptor
MQLLRNLGSILTAVLIPQIAGGLGALATQTSVNTWYKRVRKPSWNPPPEMFAPVWTGLYFLMGLASWFVWREGRKEHAVGKPVRKALGLYSLQLALNSLWSIIFFGLRRTGWALGEIGLLWGLIFKTTQTFLKVNPLAGMLMLPYQAWVTFAAALNAAIWWLNRDR